MLVHNIINIFKYVVQVNENRLNVTLRCFIIRLIANGIPVPFGFLCVRIVSFDTNLDHIIRCFSEFISFVGDSTSVF